MASTDSIGATAASGTTSLTAAQNKTVGKDEFFRMLVAQLKNQDPLNPQDGSAFAAQLAQFSSLEQLSNLNTALTSQNLNMSNLLNAQSVSLIGKEVTVDKAATGTSEASTLSGQVSSVLFKDGAIYLTVNGQEIAFSDVTSVK